MFFGIDRFMGLNQSADEHRVGVRYAPEARNVDVSDGSLTVSKGYEALIPEGVPGGIGSLGAYFRRDANGGLNARVLAANAKGFYEWTGTQWAARYLSDGSPRVCFLNVQYEGEDMLLAADAERGALIWDGAAMGPIPNLPARFSQLTLHYERIWGSGVGAEPDNVYWSRAFDPSNWAGDPENPDGAGGVVSLPTYNGGRVIALRTLYGDVLAFKDDDLYRIVGTYPGNYEVARVHGIAGPIAPATIVDAGDRCYFLGRDGLCAYDGVSARLVGDRRAAAFFRGIDPASAVNACAARHRGKLYLAAPSTGSDHNDRVLELDLQGGGYMERDGIRADAFLPLGEDLLFAGEGGRICRYGHGDTLGGEPQHAWWRTPWMDLSRPGVEKYVSAVSTFASGTFRLLFETDEGEQARVIEAGETERPVRARIGRHGRRFRMTISNVGGSRFRIRGGLDIELEEGS